MKEKVLVIMSTYNGEKYIKQQIDSIFAQVGVDVDILIRDDGSKDRTVEIIKSLYPNIKLIEGENKGYKQSFMLALKAAENYKYYAFSDQDDVWLPEKLSVGIKAIENHYDTPSFYCSNLIVTDEKLNRLSMLHKDSERIRMSISNAVVENISYGCTLIFNKKLRDLALKKIPKYVSHDGWINLVGLYFGIGIYDDKSYILYRQHGKNVLGGDRSIKTVWKKRMKSFKKLKEHHRDLEAFEFYKVYSNMMNRSQKETTLKVANYRKSLINKLRLLFDRKIKMSTFDRDFWYRVRVICSNI